MRRSSGGSVRWRARGAVGALRESPVSVRDGAIAVVLAAVAFMPGFVNYGVSLGELHLRQLDGLNVLVALGQCLPLAALHRAPTVCLVVVGVFFVAGQLLGYPSNFGTEGVLVALYGAGAYIDRGRRTAACAAGAFYLGLAICLHARHSPERPIDFVTFFLVLAAFWAAGAWMRGRHATETARRVREAEAAVAAERTRIARELHDFVAHHVTAMVVQADAAQFTLPADAAGKAAEGLEAIGGTGRRALAELRYLLGALNAPGDAAAVRNVPPPPHMGRPEELVDQARRSGQPVEFTQDGTPRANAGGVELTAYRIIQETLTNAITCALRPRPTAPSPCAHACRWTARRDSRAAGPYQDRGPR